MYGGEGGSMLEKAGRMSDGDDDDDGRGRPSGVGLPEAGRARSIRRP